MKDFKVVIPARFGSTRLPGKPLADLHGLPMVVRVVRQAEQSGAAAVVVATDDERVRAAVESAGGEACLTRPDHPSGSDRIMEVAEQMGWAGDAIVVNVQGDEPLIPPQVIGQVADLLLQDPDTGVATLCEPITDLAQVFDPNVVKVVRGEDGFARYFSRAPLPYAREVFPAATDQARRSGGVAAGPVPEARAWFRHIGIYGYRLAALRQFVGLPVAALERIEALEQLRLVAHGIGIRVAEAAAAVPPGVDTESDLERVRRQLAGAAGERR